MSEVKQNKREIIAEAINAGGATKESLMAVAEVNSAGLSSQFTYLRLTGKYPVKGDDGFFKFVDEAAWNAMKSTSATSRTTSAPQKSIEERKVAIDKKVAKLQEAFDKRNEAYKAEKNEMNKLRRTKAEAEIQIALLEQAAIDAEIADLPVGEPTED
jgi:hypothetical protein